MAVGSGAVWRLARYLTPSSTTLRVPYSSHDRAGSSQKRKEVKYMAKILILGGGFAAVSAAETLTSAVNAGHEVTLVSKSTELTFYPAIVPMVFGDLEPRDICAELREP